MHNILGVMGVKSKQPGSENLNDPYSAGGTNVERGLNTTGKEYANMVGRLLVSDPYARYRTSIAAPAPTLQLNALGLTTGQQGGFEEAVRQAANRYSGNFSDRGFNTPRAIGAIAGSAAQNVVPQYAPLMSQNLRDQFEQRLMAPQFERADRDFAANLEDLRLNQMLNLLPQYQQDVSRSRGPGIGYNTTNAAVDNWFQMWNNIGSFWGGAGGAAKMGGGGGGAICWIAGAIYGEGSAEQAAIRAWLLESAATSRFWNGFVRFYRYVGPSVAVYMRRSRILTAMLRPFFNLILRRT